LAFEDTSLAFLDRKESHRKTLFPTTVHIENRIYLYPAAHKIVNFPKVRRLFSRDCMQVKVKALSGAAAGVYGSRDA
jgi:hypothetical protein